MCECAAAGRMAATVPEEILEGQNRKTILENRVDEKWILDAASPGATAPSRLAPCSSLRQWAIVRRSAGPNVALWARRTMTDDGAQLSSRRLGAVGNLLSALFFFLHDNVTFQTRSPSPLMMACSCSDERAASNDPVRTVRVAISPGLRPRRRERARDRQRGQWSQFRAHKLDPP